MTTVNELAKHIAEGIKQGSLVDKAEISDVRIVNIEGGPRLFSIESIELCNGGKTIVLRVATPKDEFKNRFGSSPRQQVSNATTRAIFRTKCRWSCNWRNRFHKVCRSLNVKYVLLQDGWVECTGTADSLATLRTHPAVLWTQDADGGYVHDAQGQTKKPGSHSESKHH